MICSEENNSVSLIMKSIPIKLSQRKEISNHIKSFNRRPCREVNGSVLNFRYNSSGNNFIQSPTIQKNVKILNLMLPKTASTLNNSANHISMKQWSNKRLRTHFQHFCSNNDQNKKLKQKKTASKQKIRFSETTESSPRRSASSSTITSRSRSASTDKDLTSTATITNIIAQSFAQNNKLQQKPQQTISYFDIDDKSLITEMSKTHEYTNDATVSSLLTDKQQITKKEKKNIRRKYLHKNSSFYNNRNKKIIDKMDNYPPTLPALSSPVATENAIDNNDDSNGIIASPSTTRKKKKKTISISLTRRSQDRSPSPETTQIIRVDVTSNLSVEYEGYSSSASRPSSSNNNDELSLTNRSTVTRNRTEANKSDTATTRSAIFKYHYRARKKVAMKKEIKLNVPCLKLELNLRKSA